MDPAAQSLYGRSPKIYIYRFLGEHSYMSSELFVSTVGDKNEETMTMNLDLELLSCALAS